MIELRTLGSLDLISPGRPEAQTLLRQPKRYAVLVYLAMSAPRGFVRRDTLLALFWPNADQARGRNVLRQTVYQLRQLLGAEAVRSRGDEELSVAPDLVDCDATRFERLLKESRAAEALELYRGDFLTGFHVPEAAPELEEWMQSEARRLRTLATAAAWALARAQEQQGNAGGAVHWARRVAALDPFNEQRLVDAMHLLARAGDRAGALHIYEEYARHAQSELGMAPAAQVQKLADELRNLEPSLAYDSSAQLETARQAAHVKFPPPAKRTRSRMRPAALWGVPVLAAFALGSAMWTRARPPAHEPVIAIGRISDASIATSDKQSTVAADLLSTSLARLQGVQVMPLARLSDVQAQLRAAGRPATSMLAAAQQLGAKYLIEGALHSSADSGLQLDLQMLDAHTGSVVRVQRARGDDLFSAIDEATSAIALAFDVRTPRERIAQVTTSSVVAYRLYDQGLQAYYGDDDKAAHRLFVAALAEDSTFAMAAYYAGLSATDPAQRQRLLQRAAALANRATDRERLLIQEGVALEGMSASMTALADTMAVRYPLDPDAQFVYGHVLLRRGDFLGAARQYRRVIAMDSLSLYRKTRCLACDAYGSLTWSYLFADSAAAAERAMREYARARPGLSAFAALQMVLARQGRFDEARSAIRTADSIAPGNVDLEFNTITVALREGSFADADARLRRMLREGSHAVRERASWYLVLSLRMQGRLREALELTEAQSNRVSRPLLLLDIGRPRQAAAAFQAQVGYLDKSSPPAPPGALAKHRAWLLTHVATSLAAAGDTTRLQALADSVKRYGQLSAHGRDPRLHHYIRGLLWKARNQPVRAADEFRQAIWSWSEGYTRANYELARTLITLGKPAEALYPLQSALRGDLESSNLYVSRAELHELLAHAFDRLGRRDSAALHYSEVVRSWRNADPALAPRVAAARARVKALSPGTWSGSEAY